MAVKYEGGICKMTDLSDPQMGELKNMHEYYQDKIDRLEREIAVLRERVKELEKTVTSEYQRGVEDATKVANRWGNRFGPIIADDIRALKEPKK